MMRSSKNPQSGNPKPRAEQLEKFKQAARDAGADQDEEVFKRRLAKIAKAPAPKAEKK